MTTSGISLPQARTVETLLAVDVLASVGLALALLVMRPAAFLMEGGDAASRAVVHLLTLGGVLSGYYLCQGRLWRRLYGRAPAGSWLAPVVWAVHTSGVGLLAWGFFYTSPLLAHVGGHYLVPTGIVLSVLQGGFTAARRRPGTPRHLASHLPGLGLLVTMGLGAMMVLDAYGGGYGMYTHHTILVHAAAGAFLFYLPFVLVRDAVESEDGTQPFSSTAPLLIPVGLGSMGVLVLALAGLDGGSPSIEPRWALSVGLALLGAVALWVGLPSIGSSKRQGDRALYRVGWSGVGVLLLFAAIRAGSGAGEGEALSLMLFAVVLFLFAVALPDTLERLAEWVSPPQDAAHESALSSWRTPPFHALRYVTLLIVAGLMLAALLAASPLLVRIAALVGLGPVLLLAWLAWGARGADTSADQTGADGSTRH